MIVSEARVLGFAGVGLLALAAIVVFDADTAWEGVDPRTGLTAAPGLERLDEARRTGDARRGAELLGTLGGLAGPALVREAYAALALELAPPLAADLVALEPRLVGPHPEQAALAAAPALAARARASLAARLVPGTAAFAATLAGTGFDRADHASASPASAGRVAAGDTASASDGARASGIERSSGSSDPLDAGESRDSRDLRSSSESSESSDPVRSDRASAVAAEVAAELAALVADPAIERATLAFFAPAADPGRAPRAAPHVADRPASSERLAGLDFAALAAEGAAGAADEAAAVATAQGLAARCTEADRPRAELRWLRRAWAAAPWRADLGLALAGALHAAEEPLAACVVLLATGDGDAEVVRRLAEAALWCDAAEVETLALERLVGLGLAGEVERSRLVDLHVFAGRPARALPHAEALARKATTTASAMLPVRLALEAGDVDAALATLASRRAEALAQHLRAAEVAPAGVAAPLAPEALVWFEEELAVLEADLRYEPLEARLAELAALDPAAFEPRYEALLRRRWRLAPLATLLAARATTSDTDTGLVDEALALARQVGDDDVVRRLVALGLGDGQGVEAGRETGRGPRPDPVRALQRLAAAERLGLADAHERALALLAAARRDGARLDADGAVQALEALARARYDERLLRAVLAASSEAHGDPRVRGAVLRLLDVHDPSGALALARAAAEARPDDAAAWSDLVSRASWAGERELELHARRALAALPLDRDEARRNDAARASLAGELGYDAEAARTWRRLVGYDPRRELTTAWLAEALAAAHLAGDAALVAELHERALDGHAEEAVVAAAVGERLFARGRLGLAAPYLERVLAREPRDANASLRLGQARSWAGDARGARRPLESIVLAEVGPGAAAAAGATRGVSVGAPRAEAELEAVFLLAEVYQALAEPRLARPMFEAVVARAAPGEPAQRLWRARSLLGLGRKAEGRAALAAILAEQALTGATRVEVAEALLQAGAPEDARVALAPVLLARAQAAAVVPGPRRSGSLAGDVDAVSEARVARLRGRIALALGERREALDALFAAVAASEREGEDVGGAELELARALDGAGEWREARGRTQRLLAAQTTLGAAAAAPELRAYDQDLGERLAALAGATLRWRGVGDDTWLGLGVFGSTLIGGERSRLSASVEWNDATGRARAVDDGATDVDTSFTSLRVGLDRREAPEHRFALGLHTFPDAVGGGRVGAFAAYRLTPASNDRARLDARLHVGDLWATPFAAAGLGGRTSGLEVEGTHTLDTRTWLAGGVHAADVAIDAPGRGEVDDLLYGARVSLGRVLSAHELRVAEPAEFDRVAPLGFSPYLERTARGAGGPGDRTQHDDDRDGTHLQVYAGLDHQALGGGDLAALLPVAESATYLLAGARADRLLADHLGGMLEVTAGLDLEGGDPAFGVDLGLTWRPAFGFEAFGRAGVGRALGRGDTETEERLLIGVQLRR